MKGLVMKAPMPLLVRYRIKWIETKTAPPAGEMRPEGVRGEAGCALARSERVAIVMGKGVFRYDEYPGAWDRLAEVLGWPASYTDRRVNGLDLAEAFRRDEVRSFPLGSVVCTATVDDARPIVDDRARHDFTKPGPPSWNGANRWLVGNGHLWRLVAGRSNGQAIPDDADQLPLGEFSDGRWGWLLGDVQPTSPIPCKGKQGVFELPADVTAAIAAEEGDTHE